MLKALSLLLLVGTTRGEFTVLERRDSPPSGFSRVGPSPSDTVLNLRLAALTQNNISGLHDTVYEVSTPGNSRYSQYLSKEKVEAFVAPSKETLNGVNAWLKTNNLTSSPITAAGDWIAVSLTVSQANALLAAGFSTFQNTESNQTVHRTLSYSIPAALRTGINMTKLSTVTNRSSPTTSISSDCPDNWTPTCIQALYGVPSTPATPAANAFGVCGFNNEFADEKDLTAFLETYRPDIASNTTFSLISIDDGINNQLPSGAEENPTIGLQYALGLATGIPVAFISTGTGSTDSIDVFTAFLDEPNYLLSLAQPPQTVVQTFDSVGFKFESSFTPQLAESICHLLYAQLAARGVSYIVNGGDFGACNPFSSTGCRAWDVAIGGHLWGRLFQHFYDKVVSEYLNAIDATDASPFNISRRAVPDISALAHSPLIFQGQTVSGQSGTVFSATIFASMIALLNNERIAAGKSSLGFLNPLIYQNPGAFNDFATGWDPVTGFGSPSYAKLREICQKI
ncbi:family S53 protease [Mycena metata]|uniref:Family S53 protease n=1 Tax=Mycena metata TaxID=1033252 RepID=A0AAD7IF59_9AGAR|nr:family S53 protease [Mycena metata]